MSHRRGGRKHPSRWVSEEAKKQFLAMDAAALERVLHRWERAFGPVSSAYARRTYPAWQSGTKGMTDLIRSHIVEIVPPELPLENRVAIARHLRSRPRQRSARVVVRSQFDLQRVREAWSEVVGSQTTSWLSGVRHEMPWIDDDVDRAVDAEEKRAVEAANIRFSRRISDIATQARVAGARPASVVRIEATPTAALHVEITAQKSIASRRLSAALPILFWIAIAGGIVGWLAWPDSGSPSDSRQSSVASEDESTATPRTTRATATPWIVPTARSSSRWPVSTPTPRVNSYTVLPGDSWHGIANSHGIDVESLYAANGLSGPTRGLNPGDIVLLPTGTSVSPARPPTTSPGFTLPSCYSPGLDTCNCEDFSTTPQAQWFYVNHDPGNVNGLDGDNDGLACEWGVGTSSRSSSVAPASTSGGRTGAICRDGTRSSATGRGACSHHGGVAQWTY